MYKLISIFCGLFFCVGAYASSGKGLIEVTLDKKEVSTGEVFTYTVTIAGDLKSPRIEPPEFKPFKIFGQSSSRSYSRHGVKSQLKVVYRYQLVAYEPGEYILRGVEVKDRGTVFQAEPVTIKVTGEAIDIEKERSLRKFNEGAVTL